LQNHELGITGLFNETMISIAKASTLWKSLLRLTKQNQGPWACIFIGYISSFFLATKKNPHFMAQLVCFLTHFFVHRWFTPGRQSPLRAVR
jgi:hypothetical protein